MSFVSRLFDRQSDHSIKELQRKVLNYLISDDLDTNPQIMFREISRHGYCTLETFIQGIPEELSRKVGQFQKLPNDFRHGRRFVSKLDSKRKGRLIRIDILEHPAGYISVAHLQMDRSSTWFWPIDLTLSVVIWILNLLGLRHLLPVSLLDSVAEFYLHEIMLEKEFLRGLLRFPKFKEDLLTEDEETSLQLSKPQNLRLMRNQGKQSVPTSKHNDSEKDESSRGTDRYWVNSFAVRNTSSVKTRNIPTSPYSTKSTSLATNTFVAIQTNTSSVEVENKEVPKTEKGKFRGIHGEYNSCYLDSLLFSLFWGTTIFDRLLIIKRKDNEYAIKTRQILKEKIVDPLRTEFYCSGENVMVLREHLSARNDGVMGSFMDVEEIYYLLVQDILKENHFIKYQGEDEDEDWGDFAHLMNINVDDPLKVISVQQNLETSLRLSGDMKMKRVPSPALVLGLPRSDRKLVHYEYVIPTPRIIIKELLVKKECRCGQTATWELVEFKGKTMSRENVAFCCEECAKKNVSTSKISRKRKMVSREEMKLLAVICIRGAHFVAFSRSKVYPHEWLFFDSMAGGYPEVTPVPQMDDWLRKFSDNPKDIEGADIPFPVQRAFTDGHICIYEPIEFSQSASLGGKFPLTDGSKERVL